MKVLVFSSMLFFLFVITLVSALNYEETSIKTKKINEHAISTIESSDRDIIDCINKRKQSAFHNLFLGSHKIQKEDQLTNKINEASSPTWLRDGATFPKAIVPKRRLISPNTTMTNSTFNLKRKQHPFYRQLRVTGSHEFALAIYNAQEEGIYGGSATINPWKPSVHMGANSKEYSAARIQIKSGTNDNFDVIEAGWHVFPWFYTEEGDQQHDDKTRFYISWTNDSYQRSCYNLDPDCDGFEMVSREIELGSAFERISEYDGEQEDFLLAIWKNEDKWWLGYNDIVVGFWPANLFNHLNTRGTQVQWGGEVFNTRNNGRFTSTQMGSGHFANQGYKKASYFQELKVKITSPGHNWISPQGVTGYTNSPQYYSLHPVASISGTDEGGFFYGGPGDINNRP